MTSPTTTQFLLASSLVYSRSSPPSDSGLQPLLIDGVPQVSSIDPDGFYAAAYVDGSGNIIIAFEGTVFFPVNTYDTNTAIDDYHILKQMKPAAYADALTFATSISNYIQLNTDGSQRPSLYVTGHSLGGAEAEYVAANANFPIAGGMTFGAPGITGYTQPPSASNLIDYVNFGDPVGNYASDTASEAGFAPVSGMNHVGTVVSTGTPASGVFLGVDSLAYRLAPAYIDPVFSAIGLVGNGEQHKLQTYARNLNINLPAPNTQAVKDLSSETADDTDVDLITSPTPPLIDLLAAIEAPLGTLGSEDVDAANLNGTTLTSPDFILSINTNSDILTVIQTITIDESSWDEVSDPGTLTIPLNPSSLGTFSYYNATFYDSSDKSTEYIQFDTSTDQETEASRYFTDGSKAIAYFADGNTSEGTFDSSYYFPPGGTSSADYLNYPGGSSDVLSITSGTVSPTSTFYVGPNGTGNPYFIDIEEGEGSAITFFDASNTTYYDSGPQGAGINFATEVLEDGAEFISLHAGDPLPNLPFSEPTHVTIDNGYSIYLDPSFSSDVGQASYSPITSLPNTFALDSVITFTVSNAIYSSNRDFAITDQNNEILGFDVLGPDFFIEAKYYSSVDEIKFYPFLTSSDFSGGTVVSSDGPIEDVKLKAGYSGYAYFFDGDNSDSVEAELEAEVPCFASGTRIMTCDGFVSVDDLVVGSVVNASMSRKRSVKWIGRRRIDCRRHPRPKDVWPIKISANAFRRGQPQRDLLLSPGHSIYAEGILIPVKFLVNGATITQEPSDFVTYFHVELDRHDVIFAEDLPCESYLDTGNRRLLSNGAFVSNSNNQVDPDEYCLIIWEAVACAPLRIAGEIVDRVASRLRRQARMLGYTLPPVSKSVQHRGISGTSNPIELLDAAWYLGAHPDVAAAGIDPVVHYARWGRAEGRLPCAEINLLCKLGLIDAGTVSVKMEDVVGARGDVVEHFCTVGWRERRRPNPYFDTGWYLDTHDIPKNVNPLLHYATIGELQGMQPSVHFDPMWYHKSYSLLAGESPLSHYLKHRHTGRFSPVPTFDIRSYCQSNAETILQGRDPYLQFLAADLLALPDEQSAAIAA